MKEVLNKTQQDQFNRAYEVYQKKGSRGQAEKTWAKWAFSEDDTRMIFQAIIAQNRARRENPVDKKYLPLFSSWLNAKQWLDPIESSIDNQSTGSLGKCKCGGEISFALEGLCSDCRHQLSRINQRQEVADILEKMGIYVPGDDQETLNEKCKKFLKGKDLFGFKVPK